MTMSTTPEGVQPPTAGISEVDRVYLVHQLAGDLCSAFARIGRTLSHDTAAAAVEAILRLMIRTERDG